MLLPRQQEQQYVKPCVPPWQANRLTVMAEQRDNMSCIMLHMLC